MRERKTNDVIFLFSAFGYLIIGYIPTTSHFVIIITSVEDRESIKLIFSAKIKSPACINERKVWLSGNLEI